MQELGALGYAFQFVTLAGFHALNFSMFELASGYAKRGMTSYAELQQVIPLAWNPWRPMLDACTVPNSTSLALAAVRRMCVLHAWHCACCMSRLRRSSS